MGCFFIFGPIHAKGFTDGFRIRMENMADVPAIRQWLANLDKELCTDEWVRLNGPAPNHTNWPDSIDWTDSIKKFHPGYVCLSTDKKDNPKLELIWGGPFAHWGLVVGCETMETPPSDPSNQISVREISKGAYVWYDHH